MVKLVLSFVAFALAVVACVGKSVPEVSEIRRLKDITVNLLRKSTGVDITRLRMVRRSGQNLQATTNGWASISLYAFGDCTGLGFYSLGWATNVCLVSMPEVNVTASSYYYSCSNEDGSWVMQKFNNTNCDLSGLTGTNVLNASPPGVCGPYPPPDDDDQNDDNNNNSTRRALQEDDDADSIYNALYSCSASSSLSLGGNYILSQYYDSDTCGQMGSFDGSLDGGCYPIAIDDEDDDGGFFANHTYASIYTSYPNEVFYFGSNCTGTPFNTQPLGPLISTCIADPFVDDDDDDGEDDEDDEDDDSIVWTGYTSALTCTVPDNTDCSSGGSDDDSLSDGAVAGAVVGSVAGAALIGGGAYVVANGGLAGTVGGMAAQGAPAAGAAAV